jgi:hypothetical protein
MTLIEASVNVWEKFISHSDGLCDLITDLLLESPRLPSFRVMMGMCPEKGEKRSYLISSNDEFIIIWWVIEEPGNV